MPVKRREIIENAIKVPGYTSIFVGGGLGYALSTGIGSLLYVGLIILGVVILNFVFSRSLHSAEKKLDNWEKIKYELDEDENG